MKNIVRVKYTGATPGADASTYTLFSTVTAFPGANYCAMGGLGRLVLALANSAAGTLKGYVSEDRGINWTQILPTRRCLLEQLATKTHSTFELASTLISSLTGSTADPPKPPGLLKWRSIR